MTGLGPPAGRGGPQVIPRPSGSVVGAGAPWLELAPEQRRIDVGSVRSAVADHVPGSLSIGIPSRGRDAAVLVPLYEGADGGAVVVLTRRSPLLRSHTHQVSFPGGGRDVGETLVQTALREAYEEIRLDPRTVEIVGELDRLVTVTTGASVVPFVGVLPPGRPELVPEPAEVEHILHVPLAELTSDDVHREELWVWPDGGEQRPVHFFELDGDTVWGATAAVLHRFLCTCLGLGEVHSRPLTP